VVKPYKRFRENLIMCKQNPLKSFRTMSGAERRAAMRAHLAASNTISFAAQDPHALTASQQNALADMAKSVCWRKSPTSPLALGPAFYVYLARDVAQSAQQSAQANKAAQVRTVRRAPGLAYGRGFAA
jgi:hypothetical protein